MAIKPNDVAVKLDLEQVARVEAVIDAALKDRFQCNERLSPTDGTDRHYYDFSFSEYMSYLTANEIKRRYREAGWKEVQISGGEIPTAFHAPMHQVNMRLYPPQPIDLT